MAGTIDFGIIKPELGDAFGAGYRASQQERQQNALRQQQMQQQQQQLDISRENLEQLKQDRIAMTQLQDQLKAAGKDPDLDKVFDALIATGRPDYVMKGIEGKRKLKEQMRFEGTARQFYPELFGGGAPVEGAAPVAAPAAPMVAAPATPAVPAPANALAAPAAPAPAPTNALVAPAAGKTPEQLRKEILFFSQSEDPRAKSMVDMLKGQLQEMTKTNVVGGRLVSGAGKEIYTAPPETSDIKEYEYAKKQGYAGTLRDWMIQQREAGATRLSVNTPVAKSLSAPVGQRAEASLAKAEGAAGMMESANMVREALNTGNVIAGPLAGPRTKFAQILEVAGAGDKEKLVATRAAIQGLATMTLESRAELKGQGQVTENEQRLLERARSADISELTIPELQQVVNTSQRLANRLWSNHQTLLKTMETDPAAADSLRYYRPATTLPAAVSEGKPKVETDKRKAGLDQIFGAPQKR